MPQGQRHTDDNKVLVALGSNAASDAGDPSATVLAAFGVLSDQFGTITQSGLYQTPAFPAGAGPDFVNAACCFHSDQPPKTILEALHDIENTFGRTRVLRWGQRTLDLDLIAVEDQILPDRATFDRWRTLPLEAQKTQAPDALILPHPRLEDRPFVLIPMGDVAADWVHPVSGLSIGAMVADLDDAALAEIQPL